MNGYIVIIIGLLFLLFLESAFFARFNTDLIMHQNTKHVEMYNPLYQNPGVISPFGGCYYPCYNEA